LRDALTFAETASATKQAGELKAKPIRLKDSNLAHKKDFIPQKITLL
jgi:hypothetical protein